MRSHPWRSRVPTARRRSPASLLVAACLLPAVLPAADLAAMEPWADPTAAARSLSGYVVESSDPRALEVAVEAYFRYRAERPAGVRKPYLFFVDLGLGPLTARGYVFDMDRLELVEGPFAVAHGRGSSATRDAVPSVFSNVPGSAASSLGLYLTRGTYAFRGRSGGAPYASIGLRLRGESGAFNDAAESRGIVVHGAPYVSADGAGRSEGCPAVELERAERLLPMLAGGAVVFLYSPNHERWLREGRWVREADSVS